MVIEWFIGSIMFVNLDKFQAILSDKQKSQNTGSKITVGSEEIEVVPSVDVVGVTLRSVTLLKKRLWHRCFDENFVKFLRTPLLQNTSGRLLLESAS